MPAFDPTEWQPLSPWVQLEEEEVHSPQGGTEPLERPEGQTPQDEVYTPTPPPSMDTFRSTSPQVPNLGSTFHFDPFTFSFNLFESTDRSSSSPESAATFPLLSPTSVSETSSPVHRAGPPPRLVHSASSSGSGSRSSISSLAPSGCPVDLEVHPPKASNTFDATSFPSIPYQDRFDSHPSPTISRGPYTFGLILSEKLHAPFATYSPRSTVDFRVTSFPSEEIEEKAFLGVMHIERCLRDESNENWEFYTWIHAGRSATTPTRLATVVVSGETKKSAQKTTDAKKYPPFWAKYMGHDGKGRKGVAKFHNLTIHPENDRHDYFYRMAQHIFDAQKIWILSSSYSPVWTYEPVSEPSKKRRLDPTQAALRIPSETPPVTSPTPAPSPESDLSGLVDLFRSPSFNISADPALRSACGDGRLEWAKAALKSGANINGVDGFGDTAMAFAAMNFQSEIVRFLLSQGARCDTVNDAGHTVLHIASKRGDPTTVRLLLPRDVTVDVPDYSGFYPLHDACFNGHTEVVKLLLTAGATVNVLNHARLSPLHYASIQGNSEVIRLLLDQAPEVINITGDENFSALHLACLNDREDSVDLLLKKGADINLRDSKGRTPMEIARLKGYTQIMSHLSRRARQLQERIIRAAPRNGQNGGATAPSSSATHKEPWMSAAFTYVSMR